MPLLHPDYDPRVSIGQKHKNAGGDLWYLFYYLPNGRRLNHSTGTKSKVLAREKAKAKEEALLDGQFTDRELEILGPGYGTPELTIEQGVERYRMITASTKTAKTKKDERSEIPRIFVDYFVKKRKAVFMKDITTALVNDYVQSEVAHLSAVTRNRYLQTIKKVFNALLKEKKLKGENPAAAAIRIPMTKKQKQRNVWIPRHHFERLLAAAKKTRSSMHIADMLELNWEIALRVDEMLTLEWHQIDFDRHLLRVVCKPQFPTQYGIGWEPKWKQERTLTLTDKAIEILRRQPRLFTAGTVGNTKELAPASLVFPKRTRWEGEVRYLRCNSIKTVWRTLNEKAELKEYGYHWHDMRRSWNRRAAELGIPVAYRAAFLGHREDVNEGNYETEIAIEFMRQRMGASMANAPDPSGAVPDLFQLPISTSG
jgi:integrase